MREREEKREKRRGRRETAAAEGGYVSSKTSKS